MNWGLFCFSAVLGIVFLMLLPAIRRGPDYVRNNGSPWKWPWYPWVLFGVLGFGVCARAYYLCYSFHGVVSSRSIFGLYFFVPFLWAANILLLELGLVAQQKKVLRLALWVPAGLVALSMTSSPREAADLGFLTLFHDTLQMSPLFLCMATATAFYFVALLRRVPAAWLAIAAVLAVFSVCGPNTYNPDTFAGPFGLPILGIGILFLAIGLIRRHAVGCLLGGWCAVLAFWIDYRETTFGAYHGAIPVHLLLAGVLVVGAIFRDAREKWIQNLVRGRDSVAGTGRRQLSGAILQRPARRFADLLPAGGSDRSGPLWFSAEKPLVLRQRAWQLVRLGGGNRAGRLSPSLQCGRGVELHPFGSDLLSSLQCWSVSRKWAASGVFPRWGENKSNKLAPPAFLIIVGQTFLSAKCSELFSADKNVCPTEGTVANFPSWWEMRPS